MTFFSQRQEAIKFTFPSTGSNCVVAIPLALTTYVVPLHFPNPLNAAINNSVRWRFCCGAVGPLNFARFRNVVPRNETCSDLRTMGSAHVFKYRALRWIKAGFYTSTARIPEIATLVRRVDPSCRCPAVEPRHPAPAFHKRLCLPRAR